MSISQTGNHVGSPPSTSVRIRVPDPVNGRRIVIEGRDPGLPEVWILDRHKKINKQKTSTIYLLVTDISQEDGICVSPNPEFHGQKGLDPAHCDMVLVRDMYGSGLEEDDMVKIWSTTDYEHTDAQLNIGDSAVSSEEGLHGTNDIGEFGGVHVDSFDTPYAFSVTTCLSAFHHDLLE
ncbi:hypothetical protein ARMGADRAFT_1037180 [Armillaria gallica]|uniref:Uncharacterized protein n=1 Tax=Armillaria gallica TaxID=47427 RepID=A0A2H3DAF3_ARMGA|nr:hypothetical protein ARMGADRAFT_1037180 [Armillaria gallica]